MTLNSFSRMHRYRQSPNLRKMLSEHKLHRSDFIYPLFVSERLKEGKKESIKGLPGVFQHSVKSVLDECDRAVSKGILSIILFGIPELKDLVASQSYVSNGIVQTVIKKIKSKYPELYVIADLCLCSYTSHGHCGVLKNNKLDNDETLLIMNKIACSYAVAGVDCVAPSGMMDGTVQSLRRALDSDGHSSVSIMAYSSKFASSLYGPFREASGVSHSFKGDRKGYQIAPTQFKEGLTEAALDFEEGADFVIVKPALWYMDIIKTLSEEGVLPVVGYHVSGEYSMIKAASEAEMLDETLAMREAMLCLKRAGCSLIISYAACDVVCDSDY
jgi:porphobilinogen synthase